MIQCPLETLGIPICHVCIGARQRCAELSFWLCQIVVDVEHTEARGLSEDLTCVVQEVELRRGGRAEDEPPNACHVRLMLRLAKIGHELASQKSALQQVQSEDRSMQCLC